MRERRKMGVLGLAGVFAFASAGTFLARAQDTAPRPDAAREAARRIQQDADRDRPDAAQQRDAARGAQEESQRPDAAQQRDAARRAPEEGRDRPDAEARAARRAEELRRARQEGRDRPDAAARGRDLNVSHGSYLLVGHGLCMALEGSSLDALADLDAGAPASAQLRQHARAAFASSERLFNNALREIGTARRADRQQDQADPQRDQADAGRRREPGAASIADAPRGDTPTERFHGAAVAYATTLRRFATQDGPAAGANPARGADRAAVALVNHALGEVLAGFELRHTIRMTGASSAEDRELLQHARQMEAEGRQALRQIPTAPGIGAPAPAAAIPGAAPGAAGQPAAVNVLAGAVVQTLIQQAHDVVRAVDELSQEARDDREGGREGGQSGTEIRRDRDLSSPAAPAADREARNRDQRDRDQDQPNRDRAQDQPNRDRAQDQPNRDRPREDRPQQPQ